MYQRLITWILLCGLALYANAQQIIRYEYWTDQDVSRKISAVTDGGEIAFSVDVSELSEGIHTFTFRAMDDSLRWSVPTTHNFLKLSSNSGGDVCEYWIDSKLSTKTRTNISNGVVDLRLDLSHLGRGFHTLYMRMQDSRGRWSSPVSYNFLVPRVPPQNAIRAYHYWFNNDVENGEFVKVDKPAASFVFDSDIMTDTKCRIVDPENIVVMKNDNGNYQIGSKNALHLRFLDSNLYWSNLQTDTFSVFVNDPDLTGFIVNPKADANRNGWSISGGVSILSSNHYSGTSNPYFQLTGNPTTMTQTVSGLPAGNYQLSLMARCQGGASLEVSVNGVATTITNEEWTAQRQVFSTDGNPFEIKLTKKGNGSACVDDLRLSLSNVATMTVQLAESVNTSDYQGMTLALSDGQQTMKQTVGTARAYTFNGLSTTNTYQLTLANQYDMAFASKRDIRLNKGANTIVLDSVAAAHDVAVSVVDADGKDVTSQTDITWYGDDGKELVKGTTIYGIPERRLLRYTITLDGELADSYQQPSQRYHYVGPDNNQITVQLEKLAMIEGQYLSMLINYQRVAKGNRGVEDGYWTGGLSNIDFNLTNTTTGQTLDDVFVRTGMLVIGSGVSAGDQIYLHASSRQGVFVDAETSFVIADEGATKVNLTLQELGGITANYESTSNPNDAGYLYDATGELVAHNSYQGHQLAFEHLLAGSYTLITMAKSQLLGNILYLKEIGNVGLQEGKDYVASTVHVKDGVLSQVDISSVPELDETRFYYTNSDSYFYANKTTTVAGNYVTLSAHVDFKSEYQGKVKDIALIVDLPDACQMVQNSAIIGTKQAAYTVNGNRIIIPLTSENYQEKVRFCVVPTTSGDYTLNAFVQFTAEEEILQPLGMAAISCGPVEINVPEITLSTKLVVSGIATPYADVVVFDNGQAIANVKANADGTWKANGELANTIHGFYHDIYAQFSGLDGIIIQTESKRTQYKRTAVSVEKVTMLHTAHPVGNVQPVQFETVYNFRTMTRNNDFYYYWPSYPDFTFLIEFSDNDTTKVSNVILNAKLTSGEYAPLKAVYDEKKNLWVANGQFKSTALPVNVSVDFDTNGDDIDPQSVGMEIQDMFNKIILEMQETEIKIDSLSNLIEEEMEKEDWDPEKVYNLFINICECGGVDVDDCPPIPEKSSEDLNNLFNAKNPEEYSNILNKILNDFANDDADFNFGFDENGHLGLYPTKEVQINLNNGDVMTYTPGNTSYSPDAPADYYGNSMPKGNWELVTDISTGTIPNNTLTFKDASSGAELSVNLGGNNGQWDYNNYDSQRSALYNKQSVFSSGFNNCSNVAQVGMLNYMNVLDEEVDMIEAIIKDWDIDKIITSPKNAYTSQKALLVRGCDNLKKIGAMKCAGAALSGLGFGLQGRSDAMRGVDSQNAWTDLDGDLAYLCPPDVAAPIAEELNKYKNKDKFDKWRFGIANVSCGLATTGGLALVAGLTLGTGIAVGIGIAAVSIGLSGWIGSEQDKQDKENAANMQKIRNMISSNPNCRKYPKHYDPYWGIPSGTPDQKVVMDPSGYVYEAVASNRLEGVTVTAYQKTSESESGDGMLWDAAQFSQKNPLFTDQNGFYAWDVPIGWWQVKYEKEGYETLFSEWLPVPPPQLDVNVAMKSTTAPEVKKMCGFTSGITIEMSRFMRPETFVDGSITVIRNGQKETGQVEMLNEEPSAKDGNSYASKMKFVPNTPFNTTDDVVVTVHKGVESYCGVPMAADHTEKVKIELEMAEIQADSAVTISYQTERIVEVSVLPKDASEGKTLRATSSSPLISSLDSETATIDADGKAMFLLHGDLPGGAILTFTLDDADLRAETRVSVVLEQMAAMPRASVRSGETVSKGTTIALTSTTEGATIYYTLDGSCPCLESSRLLYKGPITINETITIKAIAVKDGLADSDIATFFYVVDDGTGVDMATQSSCQVERREGCVVVKNAQGATCRIYDTMGQLLVQRTNLHEIEQIALPQHDIVIVTVELPDNTLFIRKVGMETR